MSVSERTIHVGLLIAALAASAWVFGRSERGAPDTSASPSLIADEPRSPLAIIPPGSAFVLTADVKGLERASLGNFLAQRLGHAGSAGKLTTLCGFDPVARLDQLALAVPSAGLDAQEHPEDFGIVASGRFTAAEIMRCASAAIAERGGEAVRTKLGSFSTVRDRKTSGEVAAKDGGTLIVSGGSYFRELLDAAEGRALERADARDARHAELRRSLGPGPIVATWLLGEGWFERVSGGETNARLSPLRALKAVGARVDVASDVRLLVLLECTDSASAGQIATLLGELRSSLDALPLDPALSGMAKRVSVSQTGARLKLGLGLEQSELTPLLSLLLGP